MADGRVTPGADDRLVVSIVMPCLNEARTVERCVAVAVAALREAGLRGEVIVADNGSTDGSQALALAAGARVVPVAQRGYGSALRGGFDAARGEYLIMGDADESYDFGEAPRLVEALQRGHDLVMGNRFDPGDDRRGRGGVMPGAMPLKNRYLGNPVLSWLGRTLFDTPVRDFHCGLRGLTAEAWRRMDIHSPGMEFASEMVVRAAVLGMRIAEVPVTLRKDGRDRPPHLRPWRDGWRHLRFMLCLSPRWMLFVPGLALLGLGVFAATALLMGPLRIAGVSLDVHTLLAACLAILLGAQWISAGVLMRAYGLRGRLGAPRQRLELALGAFTLERGLIAGGTIALTGLAPLVRLVWTWSRVDFGGLDVTQTLRPVIVGFTLVALGFQVMLTAILAAMMRGSAAR